jgi:acyl-CoA thioester hydrolase
MSLSAEVEIEIPFFDVDPMAVAWHGHYVKYFEVARCAMLRKIDYDYPKMHESGYLFPVVELYLKYVNAARYGQLVVVAAELLEYENRLKIGYRIRDKATSQRLTKGWSVQVAIDAKTRELQFISPKILIEKLRGR